VPRTRNAGVAIAVAGAIAMLSPAIATARTVQLSERAQLHRLSHDGSVHRFGGTATGTVPGNVAATLRIRLTSIGGTVVFYARGGSISVAVNGAPKSLSRVGGTMTVTGGTGRYAGARGTATFSGTLDRRTWRATVKADGRLTY
jgi:hypothetical protein